MDLSITSMPIPIFHPNPTCLSASPSLISPKVARFRQFIDDMTEVDENIHDYVKHEIHPDDDSDSIPDDMHDDAHDNTRRQREDKDDTEDNVDTDDKNITISSSPQYAESSYIPDDPTDGPFDDPSVPSSPPKLDAKRIRSIYMNCIARFHLQKDFYDADIDKVSLSALASSSGTSSNE
jgi:hypothetical protein